MTERSKLQIFEDKDSFWILTDEAEFVDGAWFGDGYVDDKFAIVPKSIPDAKNRAKLIVDSVNNAQRYKEALEFYAKKKNYEGAPYKSAIDVDKGSVAKNALKNNPQSLKQDK